MAAWPPFFPPISLCTSMYCDKFQWSIDKPSFPVEMADLPGVVVMNRSDLTAPEVQGRIKEMLSHRKADVVMR